MSEAVPLPAIATREYAESLCQSYSNRIEELVLAQEALSKLSILPLPILATIVSATKSADRTKYITEESPTMSRPSYSSRGSDSPPRVRFNPEPLGPTPRGQPNTTPPPLPRGRPQTVPPSRPPPRTRPESYSPSRSRSRTRSPDRPQDRSRDRSRSQSRDRQPYYHDSDRPLPPPQRRPSPPKDDKHFYQKKTLWTGLATLATVAALLPTAVSAKASVESAHASGRAARASERSAHNVAKSARASELSARAAASSSIAQGHMDEYGRVVRKDSGGGRSMGGSRAGSYIGSGAGGARQAVQARQIMGVRESSYVGGGGRREMAYGRGW